MADKEEDNFVTLLMKWYSKQKDAAKDTISSDKVGENVKT